MNFETEKQRIVEEYERRAREIPAGYYALTRPANLMMIQQAQRACVRLLGRAGLFPLKGRRILDVGCGSGDWLLEFVQWEADPGDLSGIDLSVDRIERALRRLPRADLRVGSVSELPWGDHAFDLVTQFDMFTSVLDAGLRRAAAREMLRVLKRGGAILWFDFRVRKPGNRQVAAIRAAELRSLFPHCRVQLAPVALAAPLARLVAPRSWALGEALHLARPLRTHYVGLIWAR